MDSPTRQEYIVEVLESLKEQMSLIENKIDNELVTTNTLLKELLDRMAQNATNVYPQVVNAPAPVNVMPSREELFYTVRKCKNEDGFEILMVAGKTFDIKNTLKSDFSAQWDNDKKTWWLVYSEENLVKLEEYLRSISDKVTIVSD
ncbi:hypothetical protein [Heterosigma akashiwo virus 01]|jgi:hypothetical protein|uniref:Uncharacterized protein n=1 Tax=Heterosigma akashiwo virus 01 TaxID=97195 RepID=A0A1C9C527_HAV01|nr:hypothetical protein D1R72_gp056 [Heterosigma akashiwo virus 01]AOM63387.1 hypothetical protein [Heterosigma akashiwo virus 01]